MKKLYPFVVSRTSAIRKNNAPVTLSGSAHIFTVGVLLVMFVVGGGYLYAVNQSAVQGYHLRVLEKEMNALKQEHANFKIAEADLRSLYRIEESEEIRMMQALDVVAQHDGRVGVLPREEHLIALK